MSPLVLLLAGLVLVLSVGLGTVAHELLHASVLRAAGVPYEFHWGTSARRGGAGALRRGRGEHSGGGLGGLFAPLASVRLRSVPASTRPWQLRLASLAPLALALPLLAIAVGAVPDPFAREAPLIQAAVLGWMACAIPSPADFSVLWHAEDVIAAELAGVPADRRG